MKLNWGHKILLLYVSFVLLIGFLVYKSTHQHFDLVSDDYYKDEIAYQKVLDAGKNQSTLSAPIIVQANINNISFHFPEEFKDQHVSGNIQFYSTLNKAWDRSFDLQASNNIANIDRKQLKNTNYKVKINWEVNNKKYYQETDINLHS